MARIERQFAGRTLAIEAGKMARQADGSCTVQFGETRFSVPAEVVYLDQSRGFGVRFRPSEQAQALAYAMGPTAPSV